MSTTNSIWRYPATIVGALIGVWAGNTIYHYVENARNYALVNEGLSEGSIELNKTLPKMLDKITRLDSCSAGDHLIIYRYTIIPGPTRVFQMDKFRQAMKPILLKNYRTGDLMKNNRDNGVTVDFDYFDESGHNIADIKIGPGDLK